MNIPARSGRRVWSVAIRRHDHCSYIRLFPSTPPLLAGRIGDLNRHFEGVIERHRAFSRRSATVSPSKYSMTRNAIPDIDDRTLSKGAIAIADPPPAR